VINSKFSFRINRIANSLKFLTILILCGTIVFAAHDADAKSKAKKHSNKPHKTTSKSVKPYNPPYAQIVIDANTGKVLFQSDADRALYPASLTKIMTLLLTFEALDTGKITLNSSVPFSTHATTMAPSKLGVRAGQSISVDTAIKALVTKSANDVAVAIGEKIGGSENRFAQLMNLKARQIGMSQTHFENASGLHNVRQVSSARDMAKLAVYLMRTYPRYYKYFSLREFTFNGKVNRNHNRLMETYSGMDGLKTGYIVPSGFNLVASAKRGNTRLIGVIFGGKSTNSRNAKMASLLDAGFEGRTLPPEDTQEASSNAQGTSSVRPILSLNNPSRPSKPFDDLTDKTRQTDETYLKKPTIGHIDNNAQPFTNKYVSSNPSRVPNTLTAPSPLNSGLWAVQIGAYQDRVGTDQAIFRALKKLPAPLNRGTPQIVPLRTSSATWVFRARIGGYTQAQANKVCSYLNDCLPISPNAN